MDTRDTAQRQYQLDRSTAQRQYQLDRSEDRGIGPTHGNRQSNHEPADAGTQVRGCAEAKAKIKTETETQSKTETAREVQAKT